MSTVPIRLPLAMTEQDPGDFKLFKRLSDAYWLVGPMHDELLSVETTLDDRTYRAIVPLSCMPSTRAPASLGAPLLPPNTMFITHVEKQEPFNVTINCINTYAVATVDSDQ